ncbi:MAG: HAD-IIIC family phosphatase [Bacteroidaceae bacterium]|nr:HAD-IIIC family phosphatase [Bacteroidaceae bacterium]
MRYFIFRNQTIEPLFGEDGIGYSGYDDISVIPDTTERYIWFYQVPFNINSQQLAEEISTYIDKLTLVLSHIENKELWILSLVNLFPIQLAGNDTQINETVTLFNTEALKLTKTNKNLRFIDFSSFTSQYTSQELINWKFYFISQMQLSTKLTKDFKLWFMRKEAEIAGKRKKCLILDLDNTLWGGILGEDGIAGIQIGGDYPGKAFYYWQLALLELQKNGVILAVCSKNNENDVLEAWEKNPFMVLKKEHFSAWRINWQDKATNIQELAKELNIGLDSMVFVDDNPTERALIKEMLPMVCVPDFPLRPYELMNFFSQLVNDYFRIYTITDEDRQKTEQYKANAKRTAERSKFIDMESYIKSLNINIIITPANSFNVSRIAQMTQKTNQFNLTTIRLTEQEINQQLADGWKIYCISVSDKFGDNGITGAIFITPSNHIENLLLSCRILGKGIEEAFVQYILNYLHREGIKQITAEYRPSPKNSQTADFYERLGFNLSEESINNKLYNKTLEQEVSIKNYYNIKMNN